MIEVTEALLALLRGGGRGALATVTRASGSTPQQPGARLLLRPDGTLVGTVGGGAIEQAVIEALRECVRDGTPRVLARELGRDLGMCCGGRMEVFVEPIEGAPRLVIFGAGHVAKATAAIARTVGFAITIVDDREELNDEARFPGCTRVLAEPRDARDRVAPTAHDWLLVVTHDHRLDEEALDLYATLPHAYLGVIGSRRKIVRILRRIRARRGALPPLDRVYAPVGLRIGAVSPEEIAVSIVGELVALRHGEGAGSHMRALEDAAIRRALDSDEPLSDDER
ncbi:XdhC family protein [Sandaracinus amylolyticus]|uniref:Xanthine and CO dehydrogenases maturation factor, XdhC/CoxF family n=1 Tax=Sandaracinus amylolyticus TaxID=927083 RepID=A0A0F6YMX3_9BACT|nr:XdhC/CoxI family protein [Sandaracinus amylolyticus]AKF11247.1 Xanthine and CO dehydrogenases maturation factor, XdhC/CoxF family [Sandaracinus amylolyticus]